MPSAIIYARFSPRPSGEQSESIELQLEKCRAYCVAHGYHVQAEHSDRELSGATMARPGLNSALLDAKRHKATLVAYGLSRIARNAKDALSIADQLQQSGANLALLDLNLDTTSPMGRCVFTILAAVAELERAQIAQRTSDAMRRKQRQGQRMSRFAPYGYAIEGETLVENLQEQAAIDLIKRHAANGLSSREICRAMSRARIPCRGSRWNHRLISRVLKAGA